MKTITLSLTAVFAIALSSAAFGQTAAPKPATADTTGAKTVATPTGTAPTTDPAGALEVTPATPPAGTMAEKDATIARRTKSKTETPHGKEKVKTKPLN